MMVMYFLRQGQDTQMIYWVMHSSKSRFIASDLRLEPAEFNLFVDCKMESGPYRDILNRRERP